MFKSVLHIFRDLRELRTITRGEVRQLVEDEDVARLWYRRPESLIGDGAGRAEQSIRGLKEGGKTFFKVAVFLAVTGGEAAACRTEETGCGSGFSQEKFTEQRVGGQREVVIREEVRGRGQEGSIYGEDR